MVDPVTAVGLAAAITQFTAYGYKVVARLQEYQTSLGEVPKAFRDTATVLPLLLNTLKTIEEHARSGSGGTTTAENVLMPIIKECRTQVESLEQILEKLLPKGKGSAFGNVKKAFSSVHQEKQVAKIVQKLRDYMQVLTFHQTARPVSLPILSDKRRPVFNVPFDRDKDFVGRTSILADIKSQLQAQRRVALSGVGGVGKSQLAIEACYRFQEENKDGHVLWIHSSSSARLIKSYQEAAKGLRLPGCDDPKVDIVRLVSDYLGSEIGGPWLVVFDNVDNTEALAMKPESSTTTLAGNPAKILVLPRNDRGSIILTTRDTRVGKMILGTNCSIPVPPMSTAEATTLLNSQVGHTDVFDADDLENLFNQLGHLPLAISQATAFINQNNISVHEYLGLLASDSADVQDLFENDLGDIRRDGESVNSVFQTWRVSFDQIRAQKPRAAKMLSLMSMLDRQAIPRELLIEESDRPVEVLTSLATLQAFSLISISAESTGETTYQLHRLVQLAMQTWLQVHAEAGNWQRTAISVVSKAFPSGQYETWPTCEKLVPHALTVCQYLPACQYMPADEECLLQLAHLYHNRYNFDLRQGRYNQAELSITKACQLREAILGKQDRKTLESMASLACVYIEQARLDEAEKLALYVRDTLTQIFGLNDIDTLWSVRRLATIFHEKGRLEEAEKLLIPVLSSMKTVLGEEHLDTFSIAISLSIVYYRQGRHNEAEKLELQIVQGYRKIHGEEHPETLGAINNLAMTYNTQRRFEEAEPLQLQVLHANKKLLGEEHPSTLNTAANLATTYHEQGRFAEAEKLLLQVTEIMKRVLGQEHPDTLRVTSNLAATYYKQGRFAEGEKLQLQVTEIRKRVLGQEHPDTLSENSNLALTYYEQGRFAEAEKLQLQVIEIMKRVLGQEHPDTLQSMEWLAYWQEEISNT